MSPAETCCWFLLGLSGAKTFDGQQIVDDTDEELHGADGLQSFFCHLYINFCGADVIDSNDLLVHLVSCVHMTVTYEFSHVKVVWQVRAPDLSLVTLLCCQPICHHDLMGCQSSSVCVSGFLLVLQLFTCFLQTFALHLGSNE